MLTIYSQNLTNYGISIPNDAVYRINLAWVNSVDELKKLLEKHNTHQIFIDLPIGRTKPPHNTYSLDDIIPILKANSNIRYFAVSNVNSTKDLDEFLVKIPQEVIIVPKIESPEGIQNIKQITDALRNQEKIIMLDHDDLYSSLTKKGELSSRFREYIDTLVNFCDKNKIIMLRTVGVIFSGEEKRTTQYVK